MSIGVSRRKLADMRKCITSVLRYNKAALERAVHRQLDLATWRPLWMREVVAQSSWSEVPRLRCPWR